MIDFHCLQTHMQRTKDLAGSLSNISDSIIASGNSLALDDLKSSFFMYLFSMKEIMKPKFYVRVLNGMYIYIRIIKERILFLFSICNQFVRASLTAIRDLLFSPLINRFIRIIYFFNNILKNHLTLIFISKKI